MPYSLPLADRPRLAAGCQFRGSDDSLPLVVANLVALGFDLILLVDHLNESIPLAQLQQLAAGRSELRVIRKQTSRFSQSGVHSMLMRLALSAGADAYLHVDADELPDIDTGNDDDGSTFRSAVEQWLADGETDALLIPIENYLQRRDVDRWSLETLDAPVDRVLGAISAERLDEAGFFGRTPLVRALVRILPAENGAQWVRWGSHRLFSTKGSRVGGESSMEVSPTLVIRHVPYPSRESLESRIAVRTQDDGSMIDNRGRQVVTWESVSAPPTPDDAHPGPAVRTVRDHAFVRIRSRIESAGLAAVLTDPVLSSDRTAMTASPADDVFADAADLLTATARPRVDDVAPEDLARADNGM